MALVRTCFNYQLPDSHRLKVCVAFARLRLFDRCIHSLFAVFLSLHVLYVNLRIRISMHDLSCHTVVARR